MRSDGCDLYYEEMGDCVSILLMHPSGVDGLDMGLTIDELARVDESSPMTTEGTRARAAIRSASSPRVPADAAALLDFLQIPPS